MIHPLFLIVFGSLALLNFSPSSLAAGIEESKENGTATKVVKTEESQEPQKVFGLLSLNHHLFQRVGKFLPPPDVLLLAQVSKYCLSTVASHFSMELTLEKKTFTKEDFSRYFNQKDGIYKEAQCLNIFDISFPPDWLRNLPKTLKSLKLRGFDPKPFIEIGSEVGSEDEIVIGSTVMIGVLRDLLKTLPGLKLIDISENFLGVEGALLIAENLKALTSLNISANLIGDEGARLIAEHLRALTSLDIFHTQIGAKGVRFIAENLKSLTFMSIGLNWIGDEGARLIAETLTALTSLNIYGNQIGDAGARLITEHLTALKYLSNFSSIFQ